MSLSIIREKFLRILSEVIENHIVNEYNRYTFNKNVLINVFKNVIVIYDSYKVV